MLYQTFNLKLALKFLLIIFFIFICSVSTRAQETIDPGSGRLELITTDISLSAGAATLKLRRSLQYHSQEQGWLGSRWRSNWENRLTHVGELVLIEENAGSLAYWQKGTSLEYTGGNSGEKVVIDKDGKATRYKADGTRDIFGENGRLIARDYRNGNVFSLHYTSDGKLSKIKGPGGRLLHFITDKTGRLVWVEASTGATVRYAYESGNLTRIHLNDGRVLRYSYNADGALIRIEDPTSGTVQLTYDDKGRVISRRWADDSAERYVYDDLNNITQHIDSSGGTTTIKFDQETHHEEIADPLGNTSKIAYDEAGRPVKVTGPTGAVAQVRYDREGRIIAVTDPLERTTRFEYLGNTSLTKSMVRPDGTRIVYEYDDQNNPTSIRLGDKELLTYAYTEEGQIVSLRGAGVAEQRFAYHPDGLLKSITDALGGKTRFDYDKRGNLVRETNPLGGVVLRRYDAQGRLVSQTDPAGAEVRFTYDEKGHLASEIDPAGVIKRYTYDNVGRLVTETGPLGHSTHYMYDSAGRLISVTGPGDQNKRYDYDKAGNLTSMRDSQGLTTQYEYDALGRVSRELLPEGLILTYRYDAAGNPVVIEDNTGARTEYTFDPAAELTSVLNSINGKTRYQFDHFRNLIASTNPLGHKKHFTYTPAGQLTSVTLSSGVEAQYEYDLAGRLIASHRPSGGITRYTYDAMGNLVSEKNPLDKEVRYKYDLAGRLLSTSDAQRRLTRFYYDASGQQTGKQLPDDRKVQNRYDKIGNLVEIDDGKFPVRYVYDKSGRQTQVEYPVINKALESHFGLNGLRDRLVLPDGQTITYEYNEAQQLAAVILPNQKKIRFSYNLAGYLTTKRYPNGIVGHYDYDREGRIVKVRYQNKSEDLIASDSYELDAEGNVIKRQSAAGTTMHYNYDPAGQLVKETSPDSTVHYRYDSGGNRLEKQTDDAITEYQYNAADQLVSVGKETLAYDDNGNLSMHTGSKEWRYTYDSENRLIKAEDSEGKSVNYGYDAGGTRVWREDSYGGTWFLYDGFDLVQELSEDLETKATYVYAPGIDRPLAMLHDGKTYYYHNDKLGSVRLLTNEAGQIVASYDYDAFGNHKASTATIPNPFTYTAREFDTFTGLYYYRARYYDPKVGRFLSLDPLPARLSEPLDLNPYLYVRNNPLRFIDPMGLAWEMPESMREMGPPEDWLKYWKMMKQSALNRGEAPPNGTDQMIRNLKDLIAREGGTVPASQQPGSSTQRIGNQPRGGGTSDTKRISSGRGGTQGTRAVRTPPRSGTVVSSNRPGRPSVNTPRPGGKVSPARGAVRGAGLGSAIGFGIEGINYWACIDEGRSHSECISQAGKRIVIGAVVGVGAGFIIASTGGTAAPVVIAVLSSAGAAAGGAQAGNRWAQAPEIKAQRQREAAMLAQTSKRLDNVLANLDGQIAALRALLQSAWNDEKKAEDRSKGIDNRLTDSFQKTKDKASKATENCSAIQKKLVNAGECASQAEQWANRARQGFMGAMSILEACAPVTSRTGTSIPTLKAADDAVEAATALTIKAEEKYRSKECNIDGIKAEIEQAKHKVKGVREELKQLKDAKEAIQKWVSSGDSSALTKEATNPYLHKAAAVAGSIDSTLKLSRQAKKAFTDFSRQKKSLLQKTIPNLRGMWPAQYMKELEDRRRQINSIGPVLSELDNYIQKHTQPLDDYIRKAETAKSNLTISLIALTADLKFTKWSLASCDATDPTGVETRLKDAALALGNLQNTASWLEGISDRREACNVKLAQQQQPPAKGPTQPTLDSIVISPSRVECDVGKQCPPFTLIGVYSDKSRKVIPYNPNNWSVPQPIRAKSAGDFDVTANYGGETATASVSIKPPAQAKSPAQQAQAGTAATTGGQELVGWGIVEPKTRKMREGGAVPSFRFGFAYLDYGDPDVPSKYEEVSAKCNRPKPGLGRRTVDCTAVDPKSSSGRQYDDQAVVIVVAAQAKTKGKAPPKASSITSACVGANWYPGCDRNLVLGSPMRKPTPGQRAQIEKLTEELLAQQGQASGTSRSGQPIPGHYTTPEPTAEGEDEPVDEPGPWPGHRPPPEGGVEGFVFGKPGQTGRQVPPSGSSTQQGAHPPSGTPSGQPGTAAQPGAPAAGSSTPAPTQAAPAQPSPGTAAGSTVPAKGKMYCTGRGTGECHGTWTGKRQVAGGPFRYAGTITGTLFATCESGFFDDGWFTMTVSGSGTVTGQYKTDTDPNATDEGGGITGTVSSAGTLKVDFDGFWPDCSLSGNL